MSDVALGKNAKLLLSRTAGGARVEFTGRGTGLESISFSRSRSSSRRGGSGGVFSTRLDRFITADCGFSCYSTEQHDPILRDVNIRRLFYTLQPQGANGRQFIGQAVATVSLDFNKDDDSVVWGVEMSLDGLPAESNAVEVAQDNQEVLNLLASDNNSQEAHSELAPA